MPNVKGTTLYGRVNYVKTYFGEDKLTEVIDQLEDPEVAQVLRNGALRSEWYPFKAFVDFIEAVDRVCGSGDGSLYRSMAGQIAEDDLKSIYKGYMRVSTPAYILGKASLLWRQYYDSGELVTVADEPQMCTFEIRDFAAPHRVHCESVAGWFERSIQLVGATNVTVKILSCRASGQARCVFEARWA